MRRYGIPAPFYTAGKFVLKNQLKACGFEASIKDAPAPLLFPKKAVCGCILSLNMYVEALINKFNTCRLH